MIFISACQLWAKFHTIRMIKAVKCINADMKLKMSLYSGCQKYESSLIFVKKLEIRLQWNFKVPKHAHLVLKNVH